MDKLKFTLTLFVAVLFTNSSKSKTKKNVITGYQFRFTSIDAINLTEFAVHLNDWQGQFNDALENLIMEADSTAEALDLIGQLLDTDFTRQLLGDDLVDQWFDGDVSGQSLNDTLVGLGLNGTLLEQLLSSKSRDRLLNGTSAVQLLNETLKGELTDEDLESNEFRMLKGLKKTYQEYTRHINYPVTLNNLFTALQNFQTSHCLLVIDNWQGVNIEQTSAIPYILRTLDLALYHRKFMMNYYDSEISEEIYDDFELWDTMLLPKNLKFD